MKLNYFLFYPTLALAFQLDDQNDQQQQQNTKVPIIPSNVLSFSIHNPSHHTHSKESLQQQPSQPPILHKRTARAALTSLSDNFAYYSLQVGIGTPSKFYSLAIDTGSSHMWLSADPNLTSSPYDYSADHGMNLTGDSGVVNYAQGGVEYLWATTAVNVAGLAIENASFGIAYHANEKFGNLRNGISGILGLGVGEDGARPNVGEMLKQGGLIAKNVYSLSLVKGNKDGSDGNLLLGGVDHSKYEGELVILPRMDLPGKKRKYLAIRLSSVEMAGRSVPVDSNAPLDTGTTLTYLPKDVYKQVLEYLNADDSNAALYGGPVFDMNANGDKVLEFNFEGEQASKTISIKARDIINPSPNPSYSIYPSDLVSNWAVLGIQNSDVIGGITLLGASFLKSVYVVYDLDDHQIAIANAKKEPGEAEIEPVFDEIPRGIKNNKEKKR